MARILVVEDEEHLATGIRFNLEMEGYEVEVDVDGGEALKRVTSGGPYDLILLDAMLPGIDGFEVADRMRKAGDFTPILMLTAKSLPEDVVHGLEVGADDYLAKPFELSVLLARIRSLLRRRDWTKEEGGPPAFKIGNADVDFAAFEVRVGGLVSRLTLLEATLLKLLVENAGRVVSKGEILEKVWNVRPDTETRAVDNFVVRLRRLIEPDPTSPRHLQTVRGVGYRLVLTPKDEGP
jgi:DNA-binding response OmpR family regulator